MKSILPSRSEPKLILLHFYSSFYLGLTDSSSSASLPEGDAQRTGLAAVWGLAFRQPVTEVDDCNIADVLFIAKFITSSWN